MHTNDKLWLTDITEHSTVEGVLYLCAIKGACPQRPVSRSSRHFSCR